MAKLVDLMITEEKLDIEDEITWGRKTINEGGYIGYIKGYIWTIENDMLKITRIFIGVQRKQWEEELIESI